MKTNHNSITWTWRVVTPSGVITIPDVPLAVAARKAGMYGLESVEPATAAEHAAAVALENLGPWNIP